MHQTNANCGREHLLSSLPQRFWIITIRGLIRKVILRCLLCQKRNKTPELQLMANLPCSRLAINKPAFFNTGVDHFGTLAVKILRSNTKRWGCLFTCMSTRAIHLEVAGSLPTVSFIDVFKRFINCPNYIFSDCGSNFKGAETELYDVLTQIDFEKVSEFTIDVKETWKFNPPDSTHMGGAWESLIKTVKTALKAILKD